MPRRFTRGALAAISLCPSVRRFRPWRSLVALLVGGAVALSIAPGNLPEADATATPMAMVATIGGPMWFSNYNSGTFGQFERTPWNNVPYRPVLVSSPVRDARFAGKYVIPYHGSRSEHVPRLRAFVANDDVWFRGWLRLGPDFPLNYSRWQVVFQLKNAGTGSPPIELSISRGQLRVQGGWGWPGNTSSPQPKFASRVVGNLRRGVWYPWTMHVKFSANPAIGCVGFWLAGTQRLAGWHLPGGTLYPGLTSYLKVGYYRDPVIGARGTVFHDRLSVARTRTALL